MTKQSLLAEFHRSHGAVFIERDGWLLADRFGTATQEYAAVRAAAGVIDLSHRAMLQFTGPDRLSFLQGLLSNDLRQMRMFEGQVATLLTQQGKVVADVRVLCAMNSFYLDCWEPLKDKVLSHVKRYLVADEVEIEDPNEEWKILSLQGPGAAAMLGEILNGAGLPGRPHQHAMIRFDGYLVCVVHADSYGSSGYDIMVQTGQLEKLARRLSDGGATWVGEQAQNILRVEAGRPRYGVDFDEDNLLLEVGLDHAVSFTKGCYLGQEVVERIRSRGHVNRKLCGLRLESQVAAASGTAILAAGKEIGKITSSVLSPFLGCAIALGYLQRDFWQPGTAVEVGATPAAVTPLPFVQPKA